MGVLKDLDILRLILGLALFLYGMQIMCEGLKKSAGRKLKVILGRMTSSPWKGFLLGLGVTAVVQSSSATTVMIVGFVNSATMTLAQSVPVTMGANVGAVVTYFITALSGAAGALAWLEPMHWMPILAIIAIGINMFVKRGKKREIASIILGFAVLMVGMESMSEAVAGLKNNVEFTELMVTFGNSPILGLLVGILVTAAVQSSAASVGILQSLSVTGLISYSAAIPIILGQNIGTCITAILSSIGAEKDGKRAALVHLYFNIIGTVIWLAIYLLIGWAIGGYPFAGETIGALDIALVHLGFKFLYVIALAPFSRYLEKLAVLSVQGKKTDKEDITARLDDRLLNTPAIAVSCAADTTADMAKIALESLKTSLSIFKEYDPKLAAAVRDEEERADLYEDALGTYLVKISGCNVSSADGHQITKLLRLIGDFERISDHAVNIVESAEEMLEKKISFSAEADGEIAVMSRAVEEILDLAFAAFLNGDVEKAMRVEPLEEVIDGLRDQIKLRHALRLQKSECTIEHGFVISDMLTNLERVADHCSNIAGCVIEISQYDALNMHQYLDEVKRGHEAKFNEQYAEYKGKYTLSAEKAM